jgi:hypothetical protein
VLYQRDMMLPFLPQEAQRALVLGEKGLRRYQHEQHLGLGHGVPSADVYAPAYDALARMTPSPMSAFTPQININITRTGSIHDLSLQ